jgi:hypothetical protein
MRKVSMMRISVAGFIFMTAMLPNAAQAQSTSNAKGKVLTPERVACRQSGLNQGLKGDALKSHIRACAGSAVPGASAQKRREKREDCLRQAEEMYLRGPAKRQFIGSCRKS